MFRRRFKNNVKNELMHDERKINNLKILMKTTIDFDDRLYERAMKRKYSRRHSGKAGDYISNRIYRNKMNPIRSNRKYDHSETIFMKLNSVMLRKLRQKKTKKNACYLCGKEGHFARNCKSKNVVRRQFNVTLKKNFKTQRKKKWKNIDYEIIEISSIDSENEKFHKIDESQNFQNVLNKKKQNNNSTTAQINAAIKNFDIDKFVFQRFKTFYTNSTKKIKSSKIKIIKQTTQK